MKGDTSDPQTVRQLAENVWYLLDTYAGHHPGAALPLALWLALGALILLRRAAVGRPSGYLAYGLLSMLGTAAGVPDAQALFAAGTAGGLWFLLCVLAGRSTS